MKLTAQLSAISMLILLSACTAPETKKGDLETSIVLQKTTPEDDEIWKTQGEVPPLIKTKKGKTLRLVRMMDGGACKNDLQGVKGIFLLYADPEDIKRIETEQGEQVFVEFEKKIEFFSSFALQQAVNRTRFTFDPFALGVKDAQFKVAKQLLAEFDRAIEPSIEKFEQESTLSIDVVPFFRSLIFYSEGCDATHAHQEENSDDAE